MFELLDFDAFHAERVPELLARGNGRLAAGAVRQEGPLAFRMPDGRAYTYASEAGDVVVRPGDRTAATVVLLGEQAWSDFVWEARTARGLADAGLVGFVRGDFGGLARWEPALRAVYDGRPLYDPGRVAGIDLHRAFGLHAPDRELRSFLATTGFLHVRGVLRPDEVAALVGEAERLRAAGVPGGGPAGDFGAAGSGAGLRVGDAGSVSARIGALADDGRLRRLVNLAGLHVVPLVDRLGGVGVVWPAAGAGRAAEWGWGNDCDRGGHPLLCPSLEVAVHLGPGTRLAVLAGSHESSAAPPGPGEHTGVPVVVLEPGAGDVTVCFGHLLRAEPVQDPGGPAAPSVRVRFAPPALRDLVGPGQSYAEVLRRPRPPRGDWGPAANR